ncbi:MAG: GGDEF domain-containing protein [Polyangiaceae bacterium]|nr:GGDEF domain-containing protein [Polyangiaceae bacterium]
MTQQTQKLEAALGELQRQIEALVREEQLRDRLTGLGNDQALAESLRNALERGEPFWFAFIEVDYFKRVNDKFGYELADGLLQKIGKRLAAFEDYIASTMPIRAHGDEFYLLGPKGPNVVEGSIHDALQRLRAEIEGIAVSTEHGTMSCTVSIGWMTSDDTGDEILTHRVAMRMLEATVGTAKIQGRNCVIRYSPDVEKAQRRSIRDDCRECNSSFTLEVPLGSPHQGELFCPNCGARIERPL